MTLASLRSQRVPLSVFVADSGSSDGTLNICRQFNVSTTYVPPGNMYAAINAVLQSGEEEWCTYLNADDWLPADSLDRLLAAAHSARADVVYGDCDYIDKAGRFVYSYCSAKPDWLPSLFRLGIMGLPQPGTLFRRELYHRLGGFDLNYRYSADADFFQRCLSQGGRFHKAHGAPIAAFRLHAHQLSQVHVQAMEHEKVRIRNNNGRVGPTDLVALGAWRVVNTPHYLVRMVRRLASRVRAH